MKKRHYYTYCIGIAYGMLLLAAVNSHWTIDIAVSVISAMTIGLFAGYIMGGGVVGVDYEKRIVELQSVIGKYTNKTYHVSSKRRRH